LLIIVDLKMRCNIDIKLIINNIDLFDIYIVLRVRISLETQLNQFLNFKTK